MDKTEKRQPKDAYQKENGGRVSDIADEIAKLFAKAAEALERGDLATATRRYEEGANALETNRTALLGLAIAGALQYARENLQRRLYEAGAGRNG